MVEKRLNLKKPLPFPLLLSCRETLVENALNFYGRFYIGPFQPGQGHTLANALRRVLLSELTGLGITCVEIEGITHEYSSLPGVSESILDILMNLKQLIFKSDISMKKPQLAYLQIQGPSIIKASHIQLPSFLKCINPEQYIATITDDAILNMKITIRQGKNYLISHPFNQSQDIDLNVPVKNDWVGQVPHQPSEVGQGPHSSFDFPLSGRNLKVSKSSTSKNLQYGAPAPHDGAPPPHYGAPPPQSFKKQSFKKQFLEEKFIGQNFSQVNKNSRQIKKSKSYFQLKNLFRVPNNSKDDLVYRNQLIANKKFSTFSGIFKNPKKNLKGKSETLAPHPREISTPLVKFKNQSFKKQMTNLKNPNPFNSHSGCRESLAAMLYRSKALTPLPILKLPKKEDTGITAKNDFLNVPVGNDREKYQFFYTGSGVGTPLLSNISARDPSPLSTTFSMGNFKKSVLNSAKSFYSKPLFLDAVFMPVNRVNYYLEVDERWTKSPKEIVIIEIWTNGSLLPREALKLATKQLLHMFIGLKKAKILN
uniref:DNA-directed RNA polymerase n=1 Tax=Koshicola spirodelophila TaxID=1707787 RepID=A0A167MFW8_9CHLO|nr:alpha subunit of RNA polymerase [Koshicola spirodelophila]